MIRSSMIGLAAMLAAALVAGEASSAEVGTTAQTNVHQVQPGTATANVKKKKSVKPSDLVGLNPQPEPPKPADLVGLNPQPEPPSWWRLLWPR